MNESIALNRKCPYQFNNDLHEFNYCITSDCQAWQKESEADGHCIRLSNGQCRCSEKDTTCDMDSLGIGA